MGAAKKQKFPPVYENTFQQARERDELEQFRTSLQLNADCASAINKALSDHYDYSTYCLDTASAVKEVVGQFGFDRTLYVLANTVQHFDHDGRISRKNKEWARTVPVMNDNDISRSYIASGSNPGLTDLFITQVRHNFLLTQPLKAPEIKAEAELIMKRFQDLREPNSANGSQFAVRVSPEFLERAKPKNMERLVSMLPFPSLKIVKAENGRDTCAVIDKSENRFQQLRMRKPSIRAQLAVKPAPSEPSVKPKDRDAR